MRGCCFENGANMGLRWGRGVAAALLLTAMTAGTHASATPMDDGLIDGQAWFEGELLDLSESWGGARACLVWREAETVECFRTLRELEAVAASVTPGGDNEGDDGVSIQAVQCSSWLYLYEHSNAGGRTLQFRDRGYWQNLGPWGFSNVTSSFRTGACRVALAESTGGGGAHYPGTTSANHYESRMVSGWDNRVSSIYLY
jgi:hypothetical protein